MMIFTPLIYLYILSIFFVKVLSSTVNQDSTRFAVDWNPNQSYPVVRRDETFFTFTSEVSKGLINVTDPYAWFEESKKYSSEINAFITQEYALTNAYLAKCSEFTKILSSIQKAGKYDLVTIPKSYGTTKDNLLYIYQHYDAKDDHAILYVANQTEIDQAILTNYSNLPGNILIDENFIGKNKSVYSLSISPDEKKLIYKIVDKNTFAPATIYIRNLSSPLIDKKSFQNYYLDEIITRNGWSGEEWTKDSLGFFYEHEDNIENGDETNYQATIRYHQLGTNVKNDLIIVKPNLDPKGRYYELVSDDKNYLLVFSTANGNEKNKVFIASLEDQKISSLMKWLCISADYENHWYYSTNIGNDFYFHTDQNAPNGKIVHFQLDFSKAKESNDFKDFVDIETITSTIIPEKSNAIGYVQTFDTNKALISSKENGQIELFVFNIQTGEQHQQIKPDLEIVWLDSWTFPTSNDLFLEASNAKSPDMLYHFQWSDEKKQLNYKLVHQFKNDFIDPDSWKIEQKLASSLDGTQIPFFIVYRKGIQFDGTKPSIMNFVGGFGYGLSIDYDNSYFSWIHDYDGILILAGPRGGNDENPQEWHKEGSLNNKHHTFEDILAVAQYCIDQKIVAKGKIIIDVETTGALSGAVVINESPEGMFGGLIGKNGLYDMLRIDQSKRNSTYITEYGNPNYPSQFDALYDYSPYNSINSTRIYPTILLLPSLQPEPWQTYKFIAKLQYELDQNPNPILMGDFLMNGDDDDDTVNAKSFAILSHALGLKQSN